MARDYRAEYRARVERGRAKGQRPSDAAGQAKRSRTSTPRVPFKDTITVGRRKVTIVQSKNRTAVMREIRAAAKKKHNTVVYAVWLDPDGGYATQVLGGRGGTHTRGRATDTATGKMRLVIGTPDTMAALFPGAPGVPAQQIVDAMKARDAAGRRVYDGFDDYLADWWDDSEDDGPDESERNRAGSGPPAGYGVAPALAAASQQLAAAGDLGDF